MRYVDARLREYERDEAYRIYVAKSLQLAPQNKYIQKDYADLIKPHKQVKKKSGDEIVMDIMLRAGLKFGE